MNSMTFQDREVNSVVALFAKVETDALVREACQQYFERYLLQPPDKINQELLTQISEQHPTIANLVVKNITSILPF